MTRARTLADLGSQSLATDAELASGLAGKLDSTVQVGKIVQIAMVTPGASVTTSSTSAVSLNWSQSMTIGSNSRLLVAGTVMAYGNGSGVWGGSSRSYLYLNGSEVMQNDHVGTITSEEQVWNVPINYLSGPLSAGTYTVAVYGSTVVSGTITFSRNLRGNLIVMEVAA